MKKAIVMGATSGMGYEVAKLLLKDGWQVGVVARRTELLEELKTQYAQQVETEKIDVTDEDSPTPPQPFYKFNDDNQLSQKGHYKVLSSIRNDIPCPLQNTENNASSM